MDIIKASITKIINEINPKDRSWIKCESLIYSYSEKDNKETYEKTFNDFIIFLIENWLPENEAILYANNNLVEKKLDETEWFLLKVPFKQEDNSISIFEIDMWYYLSNSDKIKLIQYELLNIKEKYNLEIKDIIPDYLVKKCPIDYIPRYASVYLFNKKPEIIRLSILLSKESYPEKLAKTKYKDIYNSLTTKEKEYFFLSIKSLKDRTTGRKINNPTNIINHLIKEYNEYYDLVNYRPTLIKLKSFISERSENIIEELLSLYEEKRSNNTSFRLFINLNWREDNIQIDINFNKQLTNTENLEKIIIEIEKFEKQFWKIQINNISYENKSDIDKRENEVREKEKKAEEEKKDKKRKATKTAKYLKKLLQKERQDQKRKNIWKSRIITRERAKVLRKDQEHDNNKKIKLL